MTPDRDSDLQRLQRALGDRYVVESELARGGWASVYLAHDVKHGRRVAIKAFHAELARSLGTDRFLREIRLVAQFQHPYILGLHDSGETDDSLYFVMPYVEGETLRGRIRREGRLPVRAAVEIARDVAAALDYAHERGIVHRDIKPENILLSGGHAIVADFGIAHALDAARADARPTGRLSGAGVTVGTPEYMSPEQALGEGDVDPRSDVYSLGCVVYEMLGGRPPFHEVTVQSVVARYVDDPLVPLPRLRDEISPAVDAAVARALSVMPDDRFPTASAFSRALLAAVPDERLVATRTIGRRWLIGAASAAALAIAAIAWWRSRAEEPAIPLAPSAVAVLPFAVHGGTESAYLRAGMVDLLGTDLDGAGDLRAVDARAVLAAVPPDDSAGVTPAIARAVARRLAAGKFVLGAVTEAGGRLRVNAALYETGSTEPSARASAEGEPSRILDIVDELATGLLAGRGLGPGARLTKLAAVTTRSLPALKHYLEGEAQLRALRADSAMDSFRAAVAADSLFALAYYRLAVAADWTARFDVADSAGKRALQLSTRLAEPDRQLLQAFLAWQGGHAADAERRYRAILREQPDNVEAWYELGEVLFHYGPVRGRSMAEARPAFERSLYFDPGNSNVRLHLLDIAAMQRDRAGFDSLLRLTRGESEVLLRRRAIAVFEQPTPATRAAVLAELDSSTDGTVALVGTNVASYLHDFDDAAEVLRLLLAPNRAIGTQAYAHALLGQLEVGRGRWRAARAQFDAAAQLNPDVGLEWRALASTAPWIPLDAAAIDSVRSRLTSWNAAAVGERPVMSGDSRTPTLVAPTGFRVHDGLHPLLRLYLLGALAARAADHAGAARAANELLHATPPPGVGTFATDLSLGVRAADLSSRGMADSALALLAAIGTDAPIERVANSPFFAHAPERFLRAELLYAGGRMKEALPWYESLGQGRPSLMYVGQALLRRASIHDSLGNRAAARAEYAEAIAVWSGCDPELAPVLARARAALARLR